MRHLTHVRLQRTPRLALGAVVALSVALTACDDDNDGSATTTDTASATTEAAATTVTADDDDRDDADDGATATTAAPATTVTTATSGNDDASATTSADVESTGASTLTLPVGTAGTIEFAVDGDDVTIASLALASGWQEISRSEDDGDVELDLQGELQRIELDADIDDGMLDVDIDTSWSLTVGTYIEPTIGGDVEVVVGDDSLVVSAIALADGWEIRQQAQSDSSFDVDLDETESPNLVEMSGEIDDGEVELETDTRVAISGS